MKKQIIINFSLIIFVLSVSILTAQNWQGGGRGNKPAICEVSGTIVDSESGKPIEYASLSVLRKDGILETALSKIRRIKKTKRAKIVFLGMFS